MLKDVIYENENIDIDLLSNVERDNHSVENIELAKPLGETYSPGKLHRNTELKKTMNSEFKSTVPKLPSIGGHSRTIGSRSKNFTKPPMQQEPIQPPVIEKQLS